MNQSEALTVLPGASDDEIVIRWVMGTHGSKEAAERQLRTVQKGPADLTRVALRRVGARLRAHTDPAPMPGYGKIFLLDDHAWYVGGDGDDDGFEKLVEQMLGAIPGIKKVTYEAESFPPRSEGWSQVYPPDEGGWRERKAWQADLHPRGQPENAGEFAPAGGGHAGGGGEPADLPRTQVTPTQQPAEVTPTQQPAEPTPAQPPLQETTPADKGDITRFVPPEGPANHPAGDSHLRDLPVAADAPLKGGLNLVRLLDLQGDGQAVFKPVTGEAVITDRYTGKQRGARPSIPLGSSWQREVAAYRVADDLGMGGLVPETSTRDVGDQYGSVQQYVPHALTGRELPPEQRYGKDGDSERLAVLDFLIGNTDRHEGNWLVSADGKLTGIDHGMSFPEDNVDFQLAHGYVGRELIDHHAHMQVPQWVASVASEENVAKAAESLNQFDLGGNKEKAIDAFQKRAKALREAVGKKTFMDALGGL